MANLGHEAQLLSYMKPAEIKIGRLFNFNNSRLKVGIKRFVRKILRALRVLRGARKRCTTVWTR